MRLADKDRRREQHLDYIIIITFLSSLSDPGPEPSTRSRTTPGPGPGPYLVLSVGQVGQSWLAAHPDVSAASRFKINALFSHCATPWFTTSVGSVSTPCHRRSAHQNLAKLYLSRALMQLAVLSVFSPMMYLMEPCTEGKWPSCSPFHTTSTYTPTGTVWVCLGRNAPVTSSSTTSCTTRRSEASCEGRQKVLG